MVRAMEDILDDVSLEADSVCIWKPFKTSLIPQMITYLLWRIKKLEMCRYPWETLVDIRDQHSFIELLSLGEAHRFAANTNMKTESSRSHAILMVDARRSVKGREAVISSENGNTSNLVKNSKPVVVQKGKLVVVDLAGSQCIDKSGSEGHTLEEAKFINLSLSALAKCINTLAENSPHVPVPDSKLTRLLRDSFGASTSRTNLIVTIGPSPRHRGETSSTIMFGKRVKKFGNQNQISLIVAEVGGVIGVAPCIG